MVNTAWADVVVPEITPTQSAWKIANALQRSSMTFYVLPDGRVLKGSSMAKNEGPPHGSKVLVAYRDIEKPQTRSPLGEDLEDVYLASQTLYLFPKQTLRSGDQIENFTQLPANIRVFSKVE